MAGEQGSVITRKKEEGASRMDAIHTAYERGWRIKYSRISWISGLHPKVADSEPIP